VSTEGNPRTHERCDACGFNGAEYDDAELLVGLRSLGDQWRVLFARVEPTRADALLRARPEPGVWSAIEYAAHSRDITALHGFGVEQALTIDEPVFDAVDGDLVERAAESYAGADIDAVLSDLGDHASALAATAETAGAATWSRGLTIGEQRSDVRRLLEHALHDSRHHLDDVERGLSSLSWVSPAAPDDTALHRPQQPG
jgi:hypothetical protein